MQSNQKGFSAIEVILALLVVGLLGAVGWLVYDRQNKETTINSPQTQRVDSSNQSSQQKATMKPATDYYKMDLPTGWKLTDEKPKNITFKDAYIYRDSTGKELIVYINIGNVGGAGDTLIEYKINNDKIALDTQGVTIPDCSTDGYPCFKGDGKLWVTASSKENIKGNRYLFDYRDDKTESLESLTTFKTLIESMRF